jgi:hypothetical protein
MLDDVQKFTNPQTHIESIGSPSLHHSDVHIIVLSFRNSHAAEEVISLCNESEPKTFQPLGLNKYW